MAGRWIVLDLEWNHGPKPPSVDYYGEKKPFLGEIIEIGAIDLEDLSEFSLILRPERLKKLNPEVAKLTGLSEERLRLGVDAKEGLRQFLDWCGEGSVLLSWTSRDFAVLGENLFFHGFGEGFPAETVDLQRVFREKFGSEKYEPPLSEAVQSLGIPEDLAYHDALSDARYAAEICGRLELRNGLNKGKMPLQAYMEMWRDAQELRLFRGRLFPEAWRLAPEMAKVLCPSCGAALVPADHWQMGPDNRYWYSLCKCPCCADSRFVFWVSCRENARHSFLRAIYPSDPRRMREWKRRYAIALRRRKAREKAKLSANGGQSEE